MAVKTLAEFKKRSREVLISGIAEEIITTNPIYAFIPWMDYAGSGIITNRETTLGDAGFYDLDGTITNKAPSVVTPVTYQATRIIGDAELDGLQQIESKSSENDDESIEIASKAKSCGRLIQQGIATGTGVNPQMNSLHSLVDSGQYTTSNGVGGAALTVDMLDELIDLVKSKDGFVDWIMMNGRDLRKYRSLLRALGGVPMMEVRMGNKTIKIEEFNGIPIFQNDWLSVTETDDGAALTGGTQSSIYAGNWDDGSRKVGCCLIYPQAAPMGIQYQYIGAKEDKDQDIHRVKVYTNFASFNKVGIARLTGISGA